MTDSIMVIKGLAEAIMLISTYAPEREWGYADQACRDAIELLKPRSTVLLKPEEIRTGMVLWVEMRNVEMPWPICMHHVVNAHLLTTPAYEDYFGDYWGTATYGKEWRLWSKLPTDAQRKAAKWDD